MKRILAFDLLVALGLGLSPTPAPAADEVTLKAAYIYNFTKFIQWPDEERPTLRLCAMGTDGFGKSLGALIGKPVRNMQIAVRNAVTLQEIPQCDLVVVTAGYAQSLDRVRQVVNGYPIVIVAESADAFPNGALMALMLRDDNIVFEVDLTTARQLGLRISAKLLQLARKVY